MLCWRIFIWRSKFFFLLFEWSQVIFVINSHITILLAISVFSCFIFFLQGSAGQKLKPSKVLFYRTNSVISYKPSCLFIMVSSQDQIFHACPTGLSGTMQTKRLVLGTSNWIWYQERPSVTPIQESQHMKELNLVKVIAKSYHRLSACKRRQN